MIYEYEWITEGNYGGGWEDIDSSPTRKEGKKVLAIRRKAEPSTLFRLVCRKIVNVQRVEVI